MALTSVIDTSNKVPGIYLKVSLGVGGSSAADAPRKTILFGNKLAAGTLAVETPTLALTEDNVETLAGRGSELHLMWRRFTNINRTGPVYLCAVTEASGTAASGTFTVTGTASASGSVVVFVKGRRIPVAVASGDANTAVAAAIEAAIDDVDDLPATAGVSTNVVTVTARHDGPRGNFISIRSDDSGAPGITVTDSGAYLASGATSDDPQNAIDAAATERYHYYVAPYSDATNLAKFKTAMTDESDPDIGLRQMFVAGSTDTLANTTTVATGLNAARGSIAWLYNGDSMPSELAAATAALYSKRHGQSVSFNFIGETMSGLTVPNAPADWPEASELVSALNNGITPLGVRNGEIYMVSPITTRSQNSGGSPDYSVLDVHKVTVPDFIADTLQANWEAFATNKKADTDDPNGDPPPPGVLTPALVRDWIYGFLLDAQDNGTHLQNVEENADNLVVELASAPDGRFNAEIPADVIEHAKQFAGDIRQIG